MTLLPRMTISPIVSPSAGTSFISSIDHAEPLRVDHPDALPGSSRARARRRASPARLPLAHRVRAVGLGEPVDVDDPRSRRSHLRDRGRVRRGARRRHVTNGRSNGWASRARDAWSTIGAPLRCVTPSCSSSARCGRRDRAQAHLAATDGGHPPGGAPTVAMEHGQRPQVHRCRRVSRSASSRRGCSGRRPGGCMTRPWALPWSPRCIPELAAGDDFHSGHSSASVSGRCPCSL